ncbi:MAG: hypothetical protein HC906_11600 [Bacteroidales bacterium]|nr:hypothetical protein [Bacteroidales bacterium]
MPVISITTNPENLWDNETGIYAMGSNPGDHPYFGANFWQDWEKPAYIEFFEPDGKQGFEMPCGIKIFGAWSRAHAQKSFSLHARGEYGEKEIEYDIFHYSPVKDFETVVLRNGGNDFLNSNIRDEFMTSLVDDLNIDHQAYRPSVIYLNGEYWGLLHIRKNK